MFGDREEILTSVPRLRKYLDEVMIYVLDVDPYDYKNPKWDLWLLESALLSSSLLFGRLPQNDVEEAFGAEIILRMAYDYIDN